MSDVSHQTASAQPLRRIVRPTPVARQRKMTIGRIASHSQLMANSFGRSTSIRRSISHEASVQFPTWLLPALPTRADDLDPYRDRDIIALRQSRQKNRVIRQVQPRGLPMAANAQGRSRSGIQTGPSSIARRLHPIRRQPNKNDAHIGPSAMPFVRVATQPQRPTARPPRTRSTNSPTRNGNRTDRDGSAPHPSSLHRSESRRSESRRSLEAVQHLPSGQLNLVSLVSTPKFESVMVARSLLATPRLNHTFTDDSDQPARTTDAHRLTLPRVSNRQSIDRSAIHRRPANTGRPLANPSSRIPLSMLYEPPRRLIPTQTLESSTRSSRTTTGAKSQPSTSPASSLSTHSSSARPVTVARQVEESPTSTTSLPSWTSFPSRDLSPNQVDRSDESNTSGTPIPTSTTNTTKTTDPAASPIPQPQLTSARSASLPSPTSSSPKNISLDREDRANTLAPSQVRRQVRTVDIPRTPGWRQVVGLSREQTLVATPPVVQSTQDALFRRVAALANPSGSPLGTPGDIARRSPVSGSIFSLAASMNAAVRLQHESSVNRSTAPIEPRRPPTQQAPRNRSSSAQTQQSHTTSTDLASTHNHATQPIREVTQPKQTDRVSRRSTDRTQRRLASRKNAPSISRRSAKSSPSAIIRSATRGQSASVQGLDATNQHQTSSVASHSKQRPSFSNMWSAVNHSISRQSDLVARRSLRLPQPKTHSLSSKPGAIIRQQFGLDNSLPDQYHGGPRRSITQDLRSQQNNRTSHALRSTSRGNPSTARVMSVAHQTRSHMSSITPGASGGIQFAGSLAKAVSYRQTHRNPEPTRSQVQAQRLGPTASARSTSSPAINRSPSPTSAASASQTSARLDHATPMTGAGANVAQNFLDRLSRKTGEDFAPVAPVAQDPPMTPKVTDDTISRSPSRSTHISDSVRTSASTSDQPDTSSHVTPSQITSFDDQPHWAIMRSASDDATTIDSEPLSKSQSLADSMERTSRAMSETNPVTNGAVMRSVVTNPSNTSLGPTPTTMSTATTMSPTQVSRMSTEQAVENARSRQEIVERGGSIASRGVLHRLVSRSVPTQRLSSPLHDLPVSPNVTPGMRIPSEAMSAMPTTPTVIPGSSSATVASLPAISPSQSTSVISRSVASSPSASSQASSVSRSSSVRRDGPRSLSIQRQASRFTMGPSEDGTISADALVQMIESGRSIPNQVVHRQISGTSSSGLIRAQRSPNQISRAGDSTIIRRSPSTSEKAAPGPVSILSQVLSPSDDSESGSDQVTTSQLLDLMDWINRIVDDRLRQELERRGVAGGRW